VSGGFPLLLALALPLTAAVGIVLTRRHPDLREAVTLVSAGLLFALVVGAVWPAVEAGGRPSIVLVQTFPGLPLMLQAEPIGVLFALLASFLWLVTSVYAIGYMRGHGEKNQTRFYAYFAIALASTMGVAFAGNLLTLFIFYEILTLSTYPLVTHSGTDEARRAGRIYLGVLLGTSISFLLLAIIWTWTLAGSLDFVPGGLLRDKVSSATVGVLLVLFVFGIGKAALMPFHRWLPAAMVAPTPVSALLHAVAVVKAGVFSIVKIVVYIFGIDTVAGHAASQWLMYAAAITIIVGSLVAMTRDNLKARLAYSTVSQLSYIVLGALLANAWGIIGAGMHMVMHGFGKITLFFCAGAILVATHKTKVSQMNGLGRAMPITMGAFLLASLSLIGLPPFGGMWSKWYLVSGALEAQQLIMLGVLILGSLLSTAYLLPIPLRAFFGRVEKHSKAEGIREAPIPCVLALGLTAAGCVVLFLNPDPFYRLMAQVVLQ